MLQVNYHLHDCISYPGIEVLHGSHVRFPMGTNVLSNANNFHCPAIQYGCCAKPLFVHLQTSINHGYMYMYLVSSLESQSKKHKWQSPVGQLDYFSVLAAISKLSQCQTQQKQTLLQTCQ